MPDRIDSYARLKARTRIPLSGAEHEYTRWGFKRFVDQAALDILQPDIYWCGGLSETLKITALATTHDLIVIPHGHSTPIGIHYWPPSRRSTRPTRNTWSNGTRSTCTSWPTPSAQRAASFTCPLAPVSAWSWTRRGSRRRSSSMSEESFLGGSGGRPILERALRLKEKLKSGGHVIGAWLSVTDPTVAEIMAHAGFDYVLIETEHSPWSLDKLQTAVMAFNGSATVPMARVPWNDQVMIKQYLDLGIEGILAPMVRTPEEAAALVAACRYPPVGRRAYLRLELRHGRDTYMARANDAIFVMLQTRISPHWRGWRNSWRCRASTPSASPERPLRHGRVAPPDAAPDDQGGARPDHRDVAAAGLPACPASTRRPSGRSSSAARACALAT